MFLHQKKISCKTIFEWKKRVQRRSVIDHTYPFVIFTYISEAIAFYWLYGIYRFVPFLAHRPSLSLLHLRYLFLYVGFSKLLDLNILPSLECNSNWRRKIWMLVTPDEMSYWLKIYRMRNTITTQTRENIHYTICCCWNSLTSKYK